MAIPADNVKNPDDFHRSGLVFAILVFAYQVMICLFYAYWMNYQVYTTTNVFDEGQIMLVSFLIILVVVGFGLLNSYITNASFSGMGLTLLIFGLTLEHYFLIKAFWEKAGTSDPYNSKTFGDPNLVSKISFVNYAQDRYDSMTGSSLQHEPQFYTHHSFVDAIACALANVVAFSSLVGRIKIIESFFLSLLGTFIYEVNNQLLWRYSVSDTGYGMRIFIFGGIMGLISSVILAKKDTTINHPRYMSIYSSRGLGLLGLCFSFCFFPCLVAAGLYKASDNKQIVLYSSVLRMYLALVAGVLGSFAMCALTYRKCHVHDVIFGGLAGGIIYSSSSDLHPNPAVPLGAGFVGGLISTCYQSGFLRNLNKNGVVVSLGHFDRYLIPGILSGILSAILYGINQGNDGNYVLQYPADRTNIQQGGYQMVGVCLSLAIGIFAGIILGVIFKVCNHHKFEDQFRDAQIFRPDFPPSKHFVEWKET